jgi:Type I phosphodiesterase / nucleotide pyrophosphatase
VDSTEAAFNNFWNQQMSRLPLFFALLGLTLFLSGCATIPLEASRTRVALLTFDGASDSYLDQLVMDGELSPGGFFAQSRQNGYVADQLTPINIANTGPSHAALFSGATPAVSGYVGQNFATPADALPKGADVFTYVSPAETLVAAARRQGKRTACLAAPGFDGRTPNYTCDYLLNFVQGREESTVVQFFPFAEESQSQTAPGSFGTAAMILAPKAGKNPLPVPLAEKGLVFLVSYSDAGENRKYDTLSFRYPDGKVQIVEPGRIYPFNWIEDGLKGTTALWLNRLDPQSGEVELYWGQSYFTVANEAMHRAVIDKLGPWPGTLDARGLHAGRINEEGFDALNEYQAKYHIAALGLLLQQKDWDLFLGYLPYLDTVQHKYLVSSPRQLDHIDKGARYAAKIKDAYANLDRWMGSLARTSEAAATNFIVASDHGMVPTHTLLTISSLIESWGYKVYGDRPEIGVYTSGASAHIYVNGDDRPGGYINQKRKTEILADLQARFQAFRSATNDTVFAAVRKRDDLAPLGLEHPGNAGDLFISAAAGFSLDPRRSPSERLFFPISFDRKALVAAGLQPREVDFMAGGFLNQASPGVHGHVAATKDIAAIFYALGPDVSKAEGATAHMLQITPTIACLLGVAPPDTAHAKPIEQICNP